MITAVFYLLQAVQFGQYTIARPGITKFLLESASEERSHAIQMLDYLESRGISYTRQYDFTNPMVSTFFFQEISANKTQRHYGTNVTTPLKELSH